MSSKGLSCNIFQLVLASCMTLLISTPTLASLNQANPYWSSVGSKFSESNSSYRFRPLNAFSDAKSNQSIPNNAYSHRQAKMNHIQNPWMAMRHQPSKVNFTTRQFYPIQRFNRLRFNSNSNGFKQPAFAKQYGWAPKQTVSFHQGSSMNHYASEKSDQMESSKTIQFYRQQPITSQGMHFRESSRNPNFVTFSDSFRQGTGKPMQPFMNKPELKPVLPVKVAPHRSEKLEQGPFVTKQLLSDSSNYRFRTDAPLAVNKVVGAYKAINASSVSKNIVNTTVTNKEGNPWDKYTFRPDEPLF